MVQLENISKNSGKKTESIILDCFILFNVYMCFVSMYVLTMCLVYMCLCSWRLEKGMESPRIEVSNVTVWVLVGDPG